MHHEVILYLFICIYLFFKKGIIDFFSKVLMYTWLISEASVMEKRTYYSWIWPLAKTDMSCEKKKKKKKPVLTLLSKEALWLTVCGVCQMPNWARFIWTVSGWQEIIGFCSREMM